MVITFLELSSEYVTYQILERGQKGKKMKIWGRKIDQISHAQLQPFLTNSLDKTYMCLMHDHWTLNIISSVVLLALHFTTSSRAVGLSFKLAKLQGLQACFENTKITCQTFTQHGLLIERLFCWFKTNIGLHWNRRAGRLNFPSLGFIWKVQSWAQKPCFTASLWSLNCIDSPLYHISMNTHVYPYLSRKRQHHLYSKSRPNAIWPLKL